MAAAKDVENVKIEMVSGPGSEMRTNGDTAEKDVRSPTSRVLGLAVLLLSVAVVALAAWCAVLTAKMPEYLSEDDHNDHPHHHPWAGTDRHVWMQYGVKAPQDSEKLENLGAIHSGSGGWAAKAAMPSARSDMQAVPYGDEGHIAVIGGKNSSSTVISDVLSYDPLLDKFTALEPLPGPRYRFGATHGPNGDVWLSGGLASDSYEAEQLASTLVYRAASGKWESGPDLSTPRGDHCMATIGNTIYAIGGWTTGYTDLASVEALDLSQSQPTWQPVADMPAPRGDLLCRCAGNKIYVAGGYHDPEGMWRPSSFQKTLFEYDPPSNSWATKAPMGQARGDGAMVMTEGGKILMMGGEFHARGQFNQIPQHDVELYYPAHDVWVPKAPMPLARFRFAAAQVGGEVFIFGGQLLCSTGWEGETEDDCAQRALASTAVFLDLEHPDVFLVARAA